MLDGVRTMLKDLIDRALILDALAASTKDDAFVEILDRVVESGLVAKARVAKIKKQLRERERLGSTGIGNGVAVPHVKSADLEDVHLILARSTTGIEYQAVDGRDVFTMFMILAPEAATDAHLRLLRWVSKLARDADFRRFAQHAGGADELRELLLEMSDEP